MPAVDHDFIPPGTIATAATGEATLDALVLASDDLDEDNFRDEFATLDHWSATRASSPGSSACPIDTWFGQVERTGIHTFSESAYTTVNPGGNVSVAPVAGAAGSLVQGSVLRWHFSCTLLAVTLDPTADAETRDDIVFRLSIVGTDNNTTTVKSTDHTKLGGQWGQSLTTSNLSATTGLQSKLEDRRFSMSGIYIHDTADSPWGNGQASVHIDSVTVEVALQDAGHTVTITEATLTVFIVPKGG